ncbi:hypothetical protein HPH06_02025 [Bifidobacterium breve]|nr:hypothetical protein HPH06_02025 [Bifidobacterium breve]
MENDESVNRGYAVYLTHEICYVTRNSLMKVQNRSNCSKHMFTTAKSMRTLISSDSYPEIQFGVKLSAGNIGSSEHVFTAPYFATFLLRRLLRAFDEGHAPLLDNPSR